MPDADTKTCPWTFKSVSQTYDGTTFANGFVIIDRASGDRLGQVTMHTEDLANQVRDALAASITAADEVAPEPEPIPVPMHETDTEPETEEPLE